MKRIIFLLLLLCCMFPSLCRGQEALATDSLRVRPQYQGGLMELGGGLIMGTGFGTAAASLALGAGTSALLLGSLSGTLSPPREIIGSLISIIAYSVALAPLVAGAMVAQVSTMAGMTGVPLYAGGRAMANCETHWQDARYDGDAQRGFSVIMDAGLGMRIAWLQLTPGYHFNQNFFLGAGVAPAVAMPGKAESGTGIERKDHYLLPVYVHGRVSFGNGMFSPYMAMSPGYDFCRQNFYGTAELGVRVRMSQNSPQSFWTGAEGVLSGMHKHLGIKVGWSF